MQVERHIEAGFTVVELLCTLSIFGLLLALALPPVQTLVVDATNTRVMYQLTSQLDEAQLVAIAYEKEVTVQFTNRVITTEIDGKVHTRTLLPDAIHVVSNYAQNKLIFRKTGQVRGGTIVLYRKNQIWVKVVIQVASGASKVVVQH
jgi:prepilin-type N-terminal cleavage/methylation domain-containing protein